MKYDCAIVGGGPAGLNAALVLGRARREVVLFDNNQPRNQVTHASHGFITRDGVTPAEFRRIAYEEVLRYPSVNYSPSEVAEIRRSVDNFIIVTSTGQQFEARKLLIATGFREILPDIPGLRECYGKSKLVQLSLLRWLGAPGSAANSCFRTSESISYGQIAL